MAGNVLEWTADRDEQRAVVRGGSWEGELSPDAWRDEREASVRDGTLGFRCAGTAQVDADAR
jgi:formylglycine-generating enzyme required for sulfatase activity